MKSHFIFFLEKPKCFCHLFLKIKNREYCLVVDKFSKEGEAEIREEIKIKENKKKKRKKEKDIYRDREIDNSKTRSQEKHQKNSHRSKKLKTERHSTMEHKLF